MKLLLLFAVSAAGLFAQSASFVPGDRSPASLVLLSASPTNSGRGCEYQRLYYVYTTGHFWGCVGTPGAGNALPAWVDLTAASGGGITGLSGDATVNGSSGTVAITLATVNSSPGTCGDSSHMCIPNVDAKGRVISQSTVSISGGSGASATLRRVTAATDTATTTDGVLVCSAVSNSVVETLPASPAQYQVIQIKRVDSTGGNSCTLTANAGQNIEGGATAGSINVPTGSAYELHWELATSSWWIF